MGTPAHHVEATEVRRDEPTNISKLNAAAEVLQLTDRLARDADPVAVDAFKAKVKAAVDGITK